MLEGFVLPRWLARSICVLFDHSWIPVPHDLNDSNMFQAHWCIRCKVTSWL